MGLGLCSGGNAGFPDKISASKNILRSPDRPPTLTSIESAASTRLNAIPLDFTEIMYTDTSPCITCTKCYALYPLGPVSQRGDSVNCTYPVAIFETKPTGMLHEAMTMVAKVALCSIPALNSITPPPQLVINLQRRSKEVCLNE